MYKILTLNKISKNGLERLPKDSYEILSECDAPDGILLRSFNMHEMELPDTLKGVARAGAGVNNIPLDKCSEKGVVVFNTPGANANAVKELVIAGLLLSSRKIVDGINWVQSLKDEKDVAKLVEKGKSQFVGPELLGKKIGVVGLGAIGVLVANAANSLGMSVMGYDPFISVDAAWRLSRGVHKAPTLDAIIAECDFITLHVPLNDETKYMINEETIAKMKNGVRILNFSRAKLVNDDAIKAALAQGKVAVYVTDFPDEGLLGLGNVITIPHLGASTPESEDNCAQMAALQLKNYLEFGIIENSVNLPTCVMPYVGRRRICVIHRNIPNVVGPLTTAVAKRGINIDNMLNKSKGDYAYTTIDIDDGDIEHVKEDLVRIEGVISVRIILP